MTLQQLKYVVAVNKYRSFAKAADACAVTQPTLSAMLMKLESELDVKLFERTNKMVSPTAAGEKIVQQAEKTLAEVDVIKNLVDEEKGEISGELKFSIGPSIAPYVLPQFIEKFSTKHPNVQLKIRDMKLSSMLNSLLDNSIDIGIGISGYMRKGIMEIPLFSEPILVYRSDKKGLKETTSKGFRWVMKETLSLREIAFNYYKHEEREFHIYEGNNLETLIHMIDCIGGSTVIPQMHVKYLTKEQQKNVHPMEKGEEAHRKVSIYVKSGYIRESVLNSIVRVLANCFPMEMLDENLKNITAEKG